MFVPDRLLIGFPWAKMRRCSVGKASFVCLPALDRRQQRQSVVLETVSPLFQQATDESHLTEAILPSHHGNQCGGTAPVPRTVMT